MSKKQLHYAQIEALRWLSGKSTDQLVKAFIQVHKESLERIGYPIGSSGTELTFPKVEPLKPLPGQLDLEEEAYKL